MINKESLNEKWIKDVAKKQKSDPILVEKVIRALYLLETLKLTNLKFIFKGGTALMLMLPFSNLDNRLYFCGNTGTFNVGNIDAALTNEVLYVEEFDDTQTSDFFQGTYSSGNPTLSEATWLAFFDLNGLESPGDPFYLEIEDSGNNTFFIYPNPSSTHIKISSYALINELLVYDIHGKLILHSFPNDFESSFDISSISLGSYIVKAKTSDEVLTSKFIKQ